VNCDFLAILLFGPPSYHTEVISLEGESPTLSAKHINLQLGSFNFLNDFVTIDAVFLRSVLSEITKIPVQVSLIAKSHKGSKIEVIHADELRHIDLEFPKGMSYSHRVHLFSRAIVDFVRLDLEVTIKLLDSDQTLTGVFAVNYATTSYALVELLVRLLIFFIGLTILIFLFPMDKTKTASPFQLKVLTILLILALLASNSFIILSYFTASMFLLVIDAVLAVTLITGASIGAILILTSARKRPEQLTQNWMMIQAAPFLVTGLLFLITALFPNISETAFQVVAYMRTAGAVVCLLRAVIGVIAYRPDVKVEKWMIAGLMGITFFVCMMSEVFCFTEPFISSMHEVQIFTYASVSTFVLFLVKIYWPVDAKEYLGIEDEPENEKLESLE
jgi:hypothetical protein